MEKSLHRFTLNKNKASMFKEYCRDMHILFERIECCDKTHFICLVSESEINNANAFIVERCM